MIPEPGHSLHLSSLPNRHPTPPLPIHSMTSAEPHPAFPAAAPSEPLPIVPKSSEGLWLAITSIADPNDIVTILSQIAAGVNQTGQNENAKLRRGEDVLSMPEWNLEDLGDENLHNMTAVLVFVL